MLRGCRSMRRFLLREITTRYARAQDACARASVVCGAAASAGKRPMGRGASAGTRQMAQRASAGTRQMQRRSICRKTTDAAAFHLPENDRWGAGHLPENDRWGAGHPSEPPQEARFGDDPPRRSGWRRAARPGPRQPPQEARCGDDPTRIGMARFRRSWGVWRGPGRVRAVMGWRSRRESRPIPRADRRRRRAPSCAGAGAGGPSGGRRRSARGAVRPDRRDRRRERPASCA